MRNLIAITSQEVERVSSDLKQKFFRLYQLFPLNRALSKLAGRERRKLRISPNLNYIPTGEITTEQLTNFARGHQAKIDRYCPHLYKDDEDE